MFVVFTKNIYCKFNDDDYKQIIYPQSRANVINNNQSIETCYQVQWTTISLDMLHDCHVLYASKVQLL